MDTNNKQMCMITIVFPTDSDDQAIGVKKKIENITAQYPDARVDFRLTLITKGSPAPNG